jgi:hypothetical protein
MSRLNSRPEVHGQESHTWLRRPWPDGGVPGNLAARGPKAVLTLLVNSRGSISNAMRMSFSRGMC